MLNLWFRDCALDDSCVFCSRCFHATDHTNHNVSFYIAQQPGGCCDCGDEEAWRPSASIRCPFHPPPDPPSTPRSNSNPIPSKPIVPSDDIPPIKNYPHRVSVPPELRESMHRTIGYTLDFIIDTLEFSPDEPSLPSNEADLRLQPSADPMMKDMYCIVLWNDDKHSFEEVVKLLCDLTECSREHALALARRVDEDGREVVEVGADAVRLLEIARAIQQIDLGVTIRRAYDTFREQTAGVIIEWLMDLTKARLGTDAVVLREVIAKELLASRRNGHGARPLSDISNPTRIDYLFLDHTKLWKKPRLSLKEVYAAVLSLSRDHKIAIGERVLSLRVPF